MVARANSSGVPGAYFSGGTDVAVADGGTGASTGIAAAQNLSHPYVLARWGVPVGLASSGSMANNGAVSGMTALPTTYSGGIWLYYPAGAVAAGVPAAPAFLWTVMSSTTAGTVYNSTWDGAGIPPLGTTTAYATTGPGAFTGIAAGEITIATVTVPAGAIGPNGSVFVDFMGTNNTAAGNKIFRVKFGATAAMMATLSTTSGSRGCVQIINGGVATVQKATGFMQVGGSVVASTPTYPAENSALSVALTCTLEKATATNHAIWDGGAVTLVYGA